MNNIYVISQHQGTYLAENCVNELKWLYDFEVVCSIETDSEVAEKKLKLLREKKAAGYGYIMRTFTIGEEPKEEGGGE